MVIRTLSRLLFIFMLFSASVGAETIGQLDSMRVACFRQLNVPDSGNAILTVAIANTKINQAIQQVSKDFPALEQLDTIVLAAGTRDYALNSNFSRINWALRVTGDSIIPLAYMPVSALLEYSSADPAPKDGDGDLFLRYFTFKQKIYFYPQNTLPDTVIIAYYGIDSLLQVDGSNLGIIPEYRESVFLYASYLMSLIQGKLKQAEAYLVGYLQGLQIPLADKKVE